MGHVCTPPWRGFLWVLLSQVDRLLPVATPLSLFPVLASWRLTCSVPDPQMCAHIHSSAHLHGPVLEPCWPEKVAHPRSGGQPGSCTCAGCKDQQGLHDVSGCQEKGAEEGSIGLAVLEERFGCVKVHRDTNAHCKAPVFHSSLVFSVGKIK